jgi:Ca2+-binding RTX toxin-like protein
MSNTSYVSFGNGGSATQWYLPGTDTAGLTAPIGGTAPVADALTSGELKKPAWDATLFNGLVGYSEGDRQVFDVVNAWNSVKNAFLHLNGGAKGAYGFDGFVQVDINASDVNGNLDLLLEGVKRGNTVTGHGNDRVEIQMLSNGGNWNEEFRISTADGDDFVVLKGLDRKAEVNAGDITYASMSNASGDWNTSGSYTKTFIDLGAGNDKFQGHGSADDVQGGAGNDLLDGGAGDDRLAGGTGDDWLNGGAGADCFVFGPSFGDDVVLDFNLSAGDVIALVGFGEDLNSFTEAMAHAAQVDGDTLITIGGEGTILLRGVQMGSLSEGDFAFA